VGVSAICTIYRRALPIILLGLLAGAGAACGSTGGATEADPPVTACALFSPTAVAQVLGTPVDPPIPSAGGGTDALAGRSGCAWATTDGTKAVLVQLVRTADMSDQVRRTGFSAEARFAAAAKRHPDEAAASSTTDFFVEEEATLHVLYADSYLTIEVASTPPDTAAPIARALAGQATRKLGRLSAP
jgi:hypothetical protein